MPWHIHGGQRRTSRSWFSPSTMLVPGTECRTADLAPSSFTAELSHWPISHHFFFILKQK